MHGQSQGPWSLIEKKLIKALPSRCGFHGCLISPTNLCYYSSTHRSACETTRTKGCSHKQQYDNTTKPENYLFTKIQERLQRDSETTFCSDPRSTWRKSGLSKYEEGVNCAGLRIRVFILRVAPWNWWSYHLNGQTSRSSFFFKANSQSNCKATQKKPPPYKTWFSERKSGYLAPPFLPK